MLRSFLRFCRCLFTHLPRQKSRIHTVSGKGDIQPERCVALTVQGPVAGSFWFGGVFF